MLEIEEGPQTTKWIRSKISVDINSLVLKGKVGYFPKWHETQSKFSVDIEPNKPLEANRYTREKDAWPSQACQSAREEIEETLAVAATETEAISGRRRLSMGNIRLTLGQVLGSYPVLRSCTIHQE